MADLLYVLLALGAFALAVEGCERFYRLRALRVRLRATRDWRPMRGWVLRYPILRPDRSDRRSCHTSM
jgi:hypothetical protein